MKLSELPPDCGYCELVFDDKTIGVGLCGKCPYNKRMVPHFKPHPAAIALYKSMENGEADAETSAPHKG